jgi:hypothetical protein
VKRAFATVLWATSLALAQTPYAGLPARAFTVEVKEVPATVHSDRALVLWMLHPRQHDRGPFSEDNPYSCPELTKGSYWSGPTRVSLVDTASGHLINKVNLTDADTGKDEFEVPYRIQPSGDFPGYYHVPSPPHRGEGKPELLHLSDYNGDGDALEVAFFHSEACMGLGTTLIGYSKRREKVIQYWLELTEGGEKSFQKWIDYLFSEKPQQPGYWKYEIDYRGRGGSLDRYEVRYDPALERFYGTLKSTLPPKEWLPTTKKKP